MINAVTLIILCGMLFIPFLVRTINTKHGNEDFEKVFGALSDGLRSHGG